VWGRRGINVGFLCLNQKERDHAEEQYVGWNIILWRVRGSVTNNNGFWIGWLDLFILLLQSLGITINYSAIANLPTSQITRTRLILVLVLRCTPCSVQLPQLNTQLNSTIELPVAPADNWFLLQTVSLIKSRHGPRRPENTAPTIVQARYHAVA
jgi:hypothetical protein